MAKVTVYSTPTCGYCHMVKDWFKENGVEFEDFDVSQDAGKKEELISKTGQMAVPVIEIEKEGGQPEIVIGFNKGKLSEILGIK